MENLANIQDLQEKVVEKIKVGFAELIPEVAWDELVRKHTQEYIEKDLPKLIKSELSEFYKGEIKKELQNPNFMSEGWGEHGDLPSEAVKKIIKELAPDFVVAAFGVIVQSVAQKIRSDLQQY